MKWITIAFIFHSLLVALSNWGRGGRQMFRAKGGVHSKKEIFVLKAKYECLNLFHEQTLQVL